MEKRIDTSADANEIQDLQCRLDEAEDTLRAIRQGEVDALVIHGPKGEMIYTLTSADYPYRLMIDEMNEGAVSVSPDSFILYSNRNFAGILGLNGTNASGMPLETTLFRKCAHNSSKTSSTRMNRVFAVNTR